MPHQLSPPANVFLFFALACEAKPFINYFGCKKNLEHTVFEIYQANQMILTVTGVGKASMAAGVAYSLALWGGEQPAIMANVGIAGHKTATLGQLWLAEKITDADSAKSHYPQYLPVTRLSSASLMTVSQPQRQYAPDTLYDMEAVAFYETATRFTSSELVLMLKVISDNEHSTIQNINAKQVSDWMMVHLETVATLLKALEQRAICLSIAPAALISNITQNLHFTVSEKNQLKKLLNRWQVLSESNELPPSLLASSTAKIFLDTFNTLIEQLPIRL